MTPELTKYWCEQGNAMLGTGLTVPIPAEHDFNAHPMTPADKLLNNAGWVRGYTLRGDRLWATADIQDEEVARKLPTTIKWTSPWINSFTDGNGREWKNVVSHLALTTRPRITEQEPFASVAAALSMAAPIRAWSEVPAGGLCLSRAGLLEPDGMPRYPVAFSVMCGGATLATDASGHEHDASGKFGKGGHGKHSDEANAHTEAAEKANTIGAHTKAAKSHRAASEKHFEEYEGKTHGQLGWPTNPDAQDYIKHSDYHDKMGNYHEAKADALKKHESTAKKLKRWIGLSLASEAAMSTDLFDDNGAAFAWSPQARAAAAAARKRNKDISGRLQAARKPAAAKPRAKAGKAAGTTNAAIHAHTTEAHGHSQRLFDAAHKRAKGSQGAHGFNIGHHHSNEALRSAGGAEYNSRMGRSMEAGTFHREAAGHHVAAAKEHYAAGNQKEAYEHAEAANAHFKAAHHHTENVAWDRGNAMKAKAKAARSGGAAMAVGNPLKKNTATPDDDEDEEDDNAAEAAGANSGSDLDAGDGDGDADDDGLSDDLDLDTSGADQDQDGTPDAMQGEDSDIGMEELLCDLLQALGVPMPDESNAEEFKRHLYEAVMSKIKELTTKGMGNKDPDAQSGMPDQNKHPTQNPHTSHPSKAQNPLIQQEAQPMYMSLADGDTGQTTPTPTGTTHMAFMSLEEINKLPDPMRGVALAMHAENQQLRGEMEASKKVTDGLRAAKLREADAQRQSRVTLLTKLSPRAKGDLDAMMANPAMALSMDDRGNIVDPLSSTLAVLEKGLADLPWLMTHDAGTATAQAQPTDAGMLDDKRADEIADNMARMMGAPAARQAG